MRNTKTAFFLVFPFLFFFIFVARSTGAPQTPQGQAPREWEYPVPKTTCPTGAAQCHWSSPALADFNNDGILDIILATNNGHVIVLKNDNSAPSGYTVLLDQDIAAYIPNMPAGSEVISSSPAVGDIDQDGQPEIVVGFGSIYNNPPTRGGMIVLEHTGQVKPGWPQYSQTFKSPGYEKTIFSSPAIGDLDNDGDLEIVAGGFDKRIYAWHHTGALLSGFPADSYLLQRFPDWDDLVGKIGDSIWGSPALSDMDGDGYLDIVVGTDEGNFDSRWGGDSGGWSCPYQLPAGWAPGYCGGSVYVLDRFGNALPGFPQYRLEIFQSSPAVTDLNGDGSPDIIIGTGDFYYNNSPDHPTYGFKVYAFDNHGNDLPGWAGGKNVGGPVPASPSVGDITGDANPEVVVLANDKKLYAWDRFGNLLPNFPMTPLDHLGKAFGGSAGTGFILADYDGDGKMEIIFKLAWDIVVVDGNGAQLSTGQYLLSGTIYNNPAVGDIDNDGKLEMVAFSKDLYVWELPNSVDDASWPMFKQDSMRQSCTKWPVLTVNPGDIVLMHADSDTSNRQVNLLVKNAGADSFNWSASASNPSVSVTPSSGTVTDKATVTVMLPTGSLDLGAHDLGTIDFSGAVGANSVVGSPQSVSIQVIVVNQIHSVYLPTITR